MLETTLTALIVAASPALISIITGLVKRLPTFEQVQSSRRPLIRAVAAAVSLVYITLTYWIGGGEFDGDLFTTTLTTLVVALIAWLSSLGWYHGVAKGS